MKWFQTFLIGVSVFAVLSCGNTRKAEPELVLFETASPPSLVADLINEISNTALEYRDEIMTVWRYDHRYNLFPVVENDTVTFLFYTNSAIPVDTVAVAFETNDFDKTSHPLIRVNDSNLFYNTFKITNPKGMEYFIAYFADAESKGKLIRDPFNPNVNLRTAPRNLIQSPDDEQGYYNIVDKMDMVSNFGGLKKHTVYIFLPPDYYSAPNKQYPVLVMQDGQNIWDWDGAAFGGWKVDTAALELIEEETIEAPIIVGIKNTSDRSEEYVGYSVYYLAEETNHPELIETADAKAAAYESFVVETVIPYVRDHYRVLTNAESTAVCGSSFGGAVSLHLAFSHPDVFGMVASLSGGNSYPGDEDYDDIPYTALPYIVDQEINGMTIEKVYLDCGQGDALDEYLVQFNDQVFDKLTNVGYVPGENLYYEIFPEHGHNERSWAKRMPFILEYLFGIDSAE